MRLRLTISCLVVLVAAGPALAHHISGTVYCDQDADGAIDVPGDSLVAGVTAVAMSLDVSPGQQFVDGTDGVGFYYRAKSDKHITLACPAP